MPKRINRIRGILKLIFATCSRNNAIHEISSAESKCIIFCRAERPTAGTEPPRRPYATFSAQSWHDGLKMTKDRNAVENRRFNRLKWLEKHERSAVDAHKRTITPRFCEVFPGSCITTKRLFRLRRRCFVIFQAHFSKQRPQFCAPTQARRSRCLAWWGKGPADLHTTRHRRRRAVASPKDGRP